MGEQLCHVCPDGHTWIVQDDGTVSPSYGYGGTRISWPGYDPGTCPEPRRDRQGRYRCPTCGTRNYTGPCAGACEPPPPACGKRPVATFEWRDYNPRRKQEPHAWVDVTQRQLSVDDDGGEQLQVWHVIRRIKEGRWTI